MVHGHLFPAIAPIPNCQGYGLLVDVYSYISHWMFPSAARSYTAQDYTVFKGAVQVQWLYNAGMQIAGPLASSWDKSEETWKL